VINGNARMVTVSTKLIDVMVQLNVKTNLTKVMTNVVSMDIASTMSNNVVVILRVNGPVLQVTVYQPMNSVVEKLLVLINPTKVTNHVVSKDIHSIMTKDVVARNLNGNVLMVIVSIKTVFVMVKLNAKMVLMKVTRNVASRNSSSTMTKNVAVRNLNGNVVQVTVCLRKVTVMVKLNAQTNLMKVTRTVASEVSTSTTTRSVAVIQRINSNVLMVTVSPQRMFVMVKSNVLTDLMKEMKSAASRNSSSTMTEDAVAKLTNSNAKKVGNVLKTKKPVMDLLLAQMSLIKT
jgi:hypothetical protein